MHRGRMNRAHFRALLPLALASATAACLPTGPDEYDGPSYDVVSAPAFGDAGSRLGVADGGVSPWDGSAGPTPVDSGTPVTTPSGDAGTPSGADAGPATDAGTPVSPDASTPPTTGGSLSKCTFTATTNAPSGSYANAYVCAIWVQNSAGKLVRTLAYYASQRARYLTAYAAARGSAAVDTTSGASINQGKSKAAGLDTVNHNLTWDLKDTAGSVVPDGAYSIRVETTSSNGTGPSVTIAFDKNGSAVNLSPADSGKVTAMHLTCQ